MPLLVFCPLWRSAGPQRVKDETRPEWNLVTKATTDLPDYCTGMVQFRTSFFAVFLSVAMREAEMPTKAQPEQSARADHLAQSPSVSEDRLLWPRLPPFWSALLRFVTAPAARNPRPGCPPCPRRRCTCCSSPPSRWAAPSHPRTRTERCQCACCRTCTRSDCR